MERSKAVNLAKKLHKQGLTAGDIAQELFTKGYRPAKGNKRKPMDGNSVRYMLGLVKQPTRKTRRAAVPHEVVAAEAPTFQTSGGKLAVVIGSPDQIREVINGL